MEMNKCLGFACDNDSRRTVRGAGQEDVESLVLFFVHIVDDGDVDVFLDLVSFEAQLADPAVVVLAVFGCNVLRFISDPQLGGKPSTSRHVQSHLSVTLLDRLQKKALE